MSPEVPSVKSSSDELTTEFKEPSESPNSAVWRTARLRKTVSQLSLWPLRIPWNHQWIARVPAGRRVEQLLGS